MALLSPGYAQLLINCYVRTGLTLTQTWNTANALETKLELADSLAKGLKAEGVFSFLPASSSRGARFNLYFKQSNFHGRAFFDLLKGPSAAVDAVISHEGFTAGASAAYDVKEATITSYSAAVGYLNPNVHGRRCRHGQPERLCCQLLPQGQQSGRGRCQGLVEQQGWQHRRSRGRQQVPPGSRLVRQGLWAPLFTFSLP